MKAIELGQKFFRLTVIGRAAEPGGKRKRRWLCACECGTFKAITGYKLTSKNVKSCGCLRRELLKKPKSGRETLLNAACR